MVEAAKKKYFTAREVGEILGISPSMLCEMRQHGSKLYRAAIKGVPAAGEVRNHKIGKSFVRYHAEQIRLWEAVLVGNMDIDEAELHWKVIKTRIGAEIPGNRINPRENVRVGRPQRAAPAGREAPATA